MVFCWVRDGQWQLRIDWLVWLSIHSIWICSDLVGDERNNNILRHGFILNFYIPSNPCDSVRRVASSCRGDTFSNGGQQRETVRGILNLVFGSPSFPIPSAIILSSSTGFCLVVLKVRLLRLWWCWWWCWWWADFVVHNKDGVETIRDLLL